MDAMCVAFLLQERSPDQFGQMFRTLPALGGNHLSASLSVPSQIRHSHSNQPGKIPQNSLKSNCLVKKVLKIISVVSNHRKTSSSFTNAIATYKKTSFNQKAHIYFHLHYC